MPTKDILMRVKADTTKAETGFKKLNSSIMKIGSAMGIAFGTAQLISFGKVFEELQFTEADKKKS